MAAQPRSSGLAHVRDVGSLRESQLRSAAEFLHSQASKPEEKTRIPRAPRPTASVETRSKRETASSPARGGTGFTPDHVATCRTIFTILDHDRDGLLETDQLRTAITALGVPPSKRVVEEVLSAAPLSLAGRVDFPTFMSAMERHLAREPVDLSQLRAVSGTLGREWRELETGGFVDRLLRSSSREDLPAAAADPDCAPDAASEPVPALALRHLLCGVATANRTHLSEADADELLFELGLHDVPRHDAHGAQAQHDASAKSARKRLHEQLAKADVDVEKLASLLSSGFIRFENA